ncbi:MAG: phospholipid carrier-dependent glycosyltransferase [Flavobacteriales bacterium]|nr:phospholipid carrier-dependent glycosyltransferase [Flavobacteriales bacterium]
MKLINSPYFRKGVFALIIVIATIRALSLIGLDYRNAHGYDEQMWTSSSISSYQMFVNHHVRPTKELDNWFPTYAWIHDIPIFAGDSYKDFKPDTIHFPYDFITIKTKSGEVTEVVKYDTLVFPRKDFQWFDRAMWTFGWKAPNAGKYIMGWFIHVLSKEKPNPDGYFVFAHPINHANVKVKLPDEYKEDAYAPSSLYSSSPFSFAPNEYVRIARIPNAILTVLIIALVFIIGWLYIHYYVGLLAAVWMMLNKTFFEVNTAVGLDSFATFFTTLALLGLFANLNAIRKNKPWWEIVVLVLITALTIGLAISSKLNAGMLAFIVVVSYVLIGVMMLLLSKNRTKQNTKSVRQSHPELKQWIPKFLLSALITGVLSISVFVGLNPQWQGHTVKKIKATRESIDDYFTKRAAILTLNEKRDNPKTYTNWTKLKKTSSMKYNLMFERISYVKNTDKFYYGTFGSLLPFKFNLLDGLFAAWGLLALAGLAWQKWKGEKRIDAQALLLISFLLIFIGNTDFLWIDWARYFTPVLPIYSILVGLGIYRLVDSVRHKINTNRTK